MTIKCRDSWSFNNLPIFGYTDNDCGVGQFKCNDGKCITLNQICDKTSDCGDAEDESVCPATGNGTDVFFNKNSLTY